MKVGELQQRLGANIRAIREECGMSQETFADEIIGVHRTHESSLERGQENVSLRKLEQLARVLGVDPLYLIRQPDEKGMPADEEHERKRLAAALVEERRTIKSITWVNKDLDRQD